MKTLTIKITGTGDKWALADMLHEVAEAVASTQSIKLEAGVNWKDGILTTEISELKADEK